MSVSENSQNPSLKSKYNSSGESIRPEESIAFEREKIEIRKGKPADLDSVLEVQKKGWKDICQKALGITTEDVDYLFENNFAKNPHKNFTVACVGKKIVGVICLGEDGEIHGFFVDSSCRGKGIGKQLLDSVVSEAKKRFGKVQVGSLTNNIPATLFYKKYGFIKTGVRNICLDLENKQCFAKEEILVLPETKVLEVVTLTHS